MVATTLATGTIDWAGPISTKYGMKTKAAAIMPNGDKVELWGRENDPDFLSLKKGQTVQLVSVDGKWKLATTSQPTTTTPRTVTSNPSNGNGNKPQPQLMTADQKQLVAEYVAEQANLLAFCLDQAHKALQSRFPHDPMDESDPFPVESEAVRSAGLSLYIAAQKRFSL